MANPSIKQCLDIVELEDRFEMTVASVDSGRCGGNKIEVEADSAPAPAEG